MLNLLKTSVAAVVFAAAPLVASAATVVISDGDTVGVTPGDTYLSSGIEGDGGMGMWRVKFIADFPTSAIASASILAPTLTAFEGLQMEWQAADGMALGSTIAGPVAIEAAPVITTLGTEFADPNLAQYLKVSWTNSTAGVDFDIAVEVAEVPVPAAGLMLLTALGGAAAMRRRSK